MDPEEVYRKHADELVRFATGLVGPFDAQDVVSEACLRAFASDRWREVRDPRAYLYRAVLNRARSERRSLQRRRLREERTAQPESVAVTEPDLDVLEAVSQLSLRQRAVVMLTYWEDLPPHEVAERLGISEGSVRRHLARARQRLREWLDG